MRIVKDINCEYIHQRCLNQEFKCKQLKRTITKFVSNATLICEETEQVVLNDGFILHLILWEKNKCQDIGMKYTSYIIWNFRSASVIFDDCPKNLTTTDNTHKCRLRKRTYPRVVLSTTCHFKEKRMHFSGTLSINIVLLMLYLLDVRKVGGTRFIHRIIMTLTL